MSPKPPKTLKIEQTLVDMHHSPIEVESMLLSDLDEEKISAIFPKSGTAARHVGIAPSYTGAKRSLTVLSLAVDSKVFHIQLQKSDKPKVCAARDLLQSSILAHSFTTFYAFNMHQLALSLYLDHRLRIVNSVDIQSACTCEDPRDPTNAISFAFAGTKYHPFRSNISSVFKDESWDAANPATARAAALRAWIAGYLPSISDMETRFYEVPKIDTREMPDEQLLMLAPLIRSDQVLDSQKAEYTKHEFTTITGNDNKLKLQSNRFQNRIRGSDNTLRVNVEDQYGARYTIESKTSEVSGRAVTLESGSIIEGKKVHSVTTIGPDGPTLADRKKDETLLSTMLGTAPLLTNPFLQAIWHDKEVEWPDTLPTSDDIPPINYNNPLNSSQEEAVQAMLSLNNSSRIVLIKGPPGTGKTTVISAFVSSAHAAGQTGIWLVAQSNVAVKNIAEKLDKIGYEAWRLLVSADFRFEWHDHLYKKIRGKVIQSNTFKEATRSLSSQDCRVILCTLSMLSHPRIKQFTSKVPLKTMVVDEASQIAVSNYVSILNSFPSIQKLCFIGDNKQLPPYGQEEVKELQSIFELEHLEKEALFLNTQYRMPPQIGEFISDAVYNGQLSSNPAHKMANMLTCFFADVPESKEKRNGTSWENPKEREVVLKIAAKLEEEGESYRIITPYDAQRTAIEKDMKEQGLAWENRCFNVDSFQGNEDDNIIISLVRSKDLGFLKDLRRTNVMLSRCRVAMFIVTSWGFLVEGKGAASLVGRLAAACGDDSWLGMEDIELGNY